MIPDPIWDAVEALTDEMLAQGYITASHTFYGKALDLRNREPAKLAAFLEGERAHHAQCHARTLSILEENRRYHERLDGFV